MSLPSHSRPEQSVNQLNIRPPLARGESQLSDYSDEPDEGELMHEVKRDAERVFNLLMRRAVKSSNLEIDVTELQTILGLLDVADDIGSSSSPRDDGRSAKYVRKPHSAPASAVIDLRVNPTGKHNTNSLPFNRTHSDSAHSQYNTKRPKRPTLPVFPRQSSKTGKGHEPRRGVRVLRRIRHALRGLIQRHTLGLENEEAAAAATAAAPAKNGKKQSDTESDKEKEENGHSSNGMSISQINAPANSNELRVPSGVESQHSSRSHESVSARSTNSGERQSMSRGLSQLEATGTNKTVMQRSLVELTADGAAPRIVARERDREREREREREPTRRSVSHRPFSKVLNDIRTLGIKSKREVESPASASPSQPTTQLQPVKRSDSISKPRHSGLKSLFSRGTSIRGEPVAEVNVSLADSQSSSKLREVALVDSISKYAEQHTFDTEEANNNGESMYVPIGSLQRQRTRNEAVIETIANCVEQLVEKAEAIDEVNTVQPTRLTAVTEWPSAPPTATATVTVHEPVRKDKAKKKTKKSAPNSVIELEQAIDAALGGVCNEVNGLVQHWYAAEPERLRKFDEDARQFLGSSNYDLFATSMRRVSQADRHQKRASVTPRHAHAHTHTHMHADVSQLSTEASSTDGNSAHGRSQSAPPRPLVTGATDVSESDDSRSETETGAGLFALLYLARRTVDLGVQTVGTMRNAKRNLMRYFCERYAQFVVENGGWSALVNADDEDYCPSTPPASANNSHPDID